MPVHEIFNHFISASQQGDRENKPIEKPSKYLLNTLSLTYRQGFLSLRYAAIILYIRRYKINRSSKKSTITKISLFREFTVYMKI